VERGLGRDLSDSTLPEGAKVHLRTLAHALDVAERDEDADATARVGRVYLEVRQAYGLAGQTREPLDPFAAFVAGMSSPAVGDAAE